MAPTTVKYIFQMQKKEVKEYWFLEMNYKTQTLE